MLVENVAALGPTQRVVVPELRDRWRELGRCTAAADREAAEQAIADMYRAARLPFAPQVVWCSSPLSLALARAHLLAGGGEPWLSTAAPEGACRSAIAAVETTRALVGMQLGRPVSSNLWDGVRDPRRVRHASWPQLARALAPAVAEELRSQIAGRVQLAVWDSIWSEVPFAVWDALCAVAEDSHQESPAQATKAIEGMWRYLPRELISAHDQFGTFAVLEYLREVCAGQILPEYDAALRLARSAGWAVAYERVCWVSERPEMLRLDGQERLHCGDGAALGFADGWQLHFWHGARVPAAWIEQREQLAPSLALTWSNIEQRRVLGEIIGWERVLAQLPTRVIDQASDATIGTLLECDLPQLGRARFLRVLCATGRTFALSVPPDCASARQANAWTYGLENDDYELEART